jgi:hypothetical protein
MNELEAWTTEACQALGIDPAELNRGVVLDLARDVAHHVLRPGAPLTTYLLGVAVGRGANPAEAAATLTDLALSWPSGEQSPTS